MRLINVITREFEEFIGEATPPYAILSHTWGDREVSHADYSNENETYKNKDGYAKIDYACRQAEMDKLLYCWVDTCNINKTSSAELQEAINSMFRWYEQAAVCYAYLSDVSRETFARDFRSARWFTRGWTLQELIAPRKIRFYDKNWVYCGDRSDFEAEISEVTGIEPMYLQTGLYQDAPIAIRMSWAARRTTTRIEDEAYCMLGLFNIFMPLIYGEGKRAFLRLQEEIVKINPDQSIYAWGLPEDLSLSPIRDLTPDDTYPGIAWGEHFEYRGLKSRLFAELAEDFRHSGSLVPVCSVASLKAAKTTGAQTITIELPIITPKYLNLHIALLPLRSRIYPYDNFGMILELDQRRYRRVAMRNAADGGFTFVIPISYAVQSNRKEITLLTQELPERRLTQASLPDMGQRVIFMADLQGNTTQILPPLDFRITEATCEVQQARNTLCFPQRGTRRRNGYTIVQLKLRRTIDTPSNVSCTIGLHVLLHSDSRLQIRQVHPDETCSGLRNKLFYDAIVLSVRRDKFVAKVVPMPMLSTFVVQVHQIEFNENGGFSAETLAQSWATPGIMAMVANGKEGAILPRNERKNELE